MTDTSEREKFEARVTANGTNGYWLGTYYAESDRYTNSQCNDLWRGWKMRAALDGGAVSQNATASNERLEFNRSLRRLVKTPLGLDFSDVEKERLWWMWTERAALSSQPAGGAVGELTFSQFRKANVTRCVKWHPDGISSWSPSDWLTAVAGELGELASLLKMRNRERDGLPGNKFSPTQKQIADELADVLTYLDLLAEVLHVDLGAAAVEKFNEVSERVGFTDRIKVQS